MKSKIIDNASDCTIKQFIECRFHARYKVLIVKGKPSDEELKDAFEYIYNQYVDMSGLFVSREFELSGYIESLEKRVNTISRFIDLQRAFAIEFGMPFVPGFAIVKKFHSLTWNSEAPDLPLFLAKLQKIETKEKRYIVEIAAKKKELFDMQRKKALKEHQTLETKGQFITMLNRLQQARFVIDRNVTSVEDLAYMIKDLKNQHDDEIAQRTFKKK